MFSTYYFTPRINKHIRVNDNSASKIEQIWRNFTNKACSGIAVSNISDNCLVVFSFNFKDHIDKTQN